MTSHRIAIYVEGLEFGGVERHVLSLVSHLDKSAFDPVVIGVMPSLLSSSLRAAGIEVVETPFVRSKFDVRNWAPLPAMIRDTRAEVLHAMLSHSFTGQYALASAWFQRLPVVATAHLPTPPANRRQAHMRRLLMRSVKVLLVPSEWTKQELSRMGQLTRRVEVVANGVDTDRARPRDEARAMLGLDARSVVIGGSMRLVSWKRPDLLVELARRLPGVDVVLFGDGPERSSLEELASRASPNSGSRVHFAGFRGDAADLLSALDVFVHPCPTDNQPLAVLEAMATGLPVVAIDGGGVALMIEHDRTGLLTQATGDGLAESVGRVLADPELRARLGAAALEEVRRRYSAAPMADRVQTIYRELIEVQS